MFNPSDTNTTDTGSAQTATQKKASKEFTTKKKRINGELRPSFSGMWLLFSKITKKTTELTG